MNKEDTTTQKQLLPLFENAKNSATSLLQNLNITEFNKLLNTCNTTIESVESKLMQLKNQDIKTNLIIKASGLNVVTLLEKNIEEIKQLQTKIQLRLAEVQAQVHIKHKKLEENNEEYLQEESKEIEHFMNELREEEQLWEKEVAELEEKSLKLEELEQQLLEIEIAEQNESSHKSDDLEEEQHVLENKVEIPVTEQKDNVNKPLVIKRKIELNSENSENSDVPSKRPKLG